MALKSDSQGFLIGDQVDIGKAVEQLRQIRADIHDIKRSMLSAPNSGSNGSKNTAVDHAAKVVTPPNLRNRDNKPVSKAATPVRSNGDTRAPGTANAESKTAVTPTVAVTPDIKAASKVVATPTPNIAPVPNATGKINSPRSRDNKPATKAATPVRSNSGTGTPSIASTASKGTVTANGRAKTAIIATPKGRDAASGRFTKKDKSESSGDENKAPNDEEKKSQKILSNLAGRIATTAIGATAGAEEVDPTIKAFKEVAEPMQRGYQTLFGGGEKDKNERWYKKIFKELNLFRKDETAFNKAQAKVLKNIEAKPVGGSGNGSGGGGLFTNLLSKIPLLKNLLPSMSSSTTTAAGAGGIGSKLLRGGKGLLGAGKGLLKRIPFLGALIGGISAASDIYGTENDDTLTRGEKDKRNGKAAGGLAGSVGGMMAGAAAGSLLGPVGTVVGGAVGMLIGDQAGQIIGEKMGEWTTQLRDADIPGKIIGAWSTTTEAIRSGWDGALKLMSSAWDKTKEAANAANDFVKDKTGVDVKAEVKNAYDNAVKYTADNIIPSLADLANKGADKLKQGAEWVGNNTTIGKGAKALWSDAKGFLAAGAETAGIDPKIVAKIANFESGFNSNAAPVRKDGTRISSAHGYGQFIDGTWTDMVNKYGAKYGIADAGKLTKQQAAKYRDDKSIQAGMLAEFTRENIEKGRKYGGTNDDANVYAFHNLGDKDAKNLLSGMKQNPAMSVRAALLQGASSEKEQARIEKVIAGNKSLYGDGNISATDAYNRMGSVMRRGEAFAADISSNNPTPVNDEQGKPKLAKVASINASSMPLYDSLGLGIGNTSQTQTAFAAAPKVPAFTPAPTPAEAPPQVTPLASLDSGRNVTVTMPTPDVGQDVRDRGIAHIVTGGLSGRG